MATRILGLEFADWVNRKGKQMGFAQYPTLSYYETFCIKKVRKSA